MKKKQIFTCLTFIFLFGFIEILNASEYKTYDHIKNISEIKKMISGIKSTRQEIELKVIPLENSGLYYYKLPNKEIVFTTSDGKYMIKGSVLKIDDKKLKRVPINQNLQLNRDMVWRVSAEDVIIYPSKTNSTKNINCVVLE
jgi:hypothetical protein